MKRFFFILLMSACCIINLSADEQLVQEKLDLVLSELEEPGKFDWDMPDFILNFFRFLGEIGLLYRILFYLFIISLVVYILYKTIFLFVKDSSLVRKYKKERLSDTPHVNDGQSNFLLRAGELCKSGNYSEALIQLHNGSCEYLFYNNLLRTGRDYTNREIFRILKGHESLKAFKEIALAAELTFFRGVEVEKERYSQLESLFKEAFDVKD